MREIILNPLMYFIQTKIVTIVVVLSKNMSHLHESTCFQLAEGYPFTTMYQMGNPSTYITISIDLYREIHIDICIHIQTHACTHTNEKL